MGVAGHNDPLLGETTCGSLLQQLQLIWDEVGESDEDRDKMLLQLEQECLDVYRRKPDKTSGTIKEQLAAISPSLEILCRKRESRSTRLRKILESVSSVHDLCSVLGMDFVGTVTKVHPSLDDSVGVQSKSISDETISKLSKMVIVLQEEKSKRFAKIQALASQLSDLWNLMDAPVEERQPFHHVTCNMFSTLDDVTVPGALALDVIQQAELEVERLDELKASRMKDVAFNKQTELEDIYARAHVAIDSSAARDRIMSIIESSSFEPSELLADMENQILKANEESLSRKDILERVDRWMSACEEESWLEDYSRDDNRYSATRGAHLKVNKIPAIVDTLVAKTRAWEQEHGMAFTYDGVPRLAMLDEYKILRREKEDEKRRIREKLFGSKPSPCTAPVVLKEGGWRTDQRCRWCCQWHASSQAVGPPERRRTASRDGRRMPADPWPPVNYVAIAKEDATSQASSN
ncbi:unnamed protein product [Miscanthus lutarioriparius]|uniref:Microtubule-associated protein MAP65-1a n=1 Tax=Miscanthus lutarioriparius TaxID=422564 RepID=A0A811S6U6_9POAL|nr:unnamed protein product [Miscanthus lutarioriparius]